MSSTGEAARPWADKGPSGRDNRLMGVEGGAEVGLSLWFMDSTAVWWTNAYLYTFEYLNFAHLCSRRLLLLFSFYFSNKSSFWFGFVSNSRRYYISKKVIMWLTTDGIMLFLYQYWKIISRKRRHVVPILVY